MLDCIYWEPSRTIGFVFLAIVVPVIPLGHEFIDGVL